MEFRTDPPTRGRVRVFQLFLGFAVILFGLYVMIKFDASQPEILIGSIFIMIVGLVIGKTSMVPYD